MFEVGKTYKNDFGAEHKILAIYEQYMIVECLGIDSNTIEIYSPDGGFFGTIDIDDQINFHEDGKFKRLRLKLV